MNAGFQSIGCLHACLPRELDEVAVIVVDQRFFLQAALIPGVEK